MCDWTLADWAYAAFWPLWSVLVVGLAGAIWASRPRETRWLRERR